MSRATLIAGKWVITTMALLLAMTVASHLIGINSAAMTVAEEVLRRSETVGQRVGDVQSIRLQFWGFSLHSEFGGDRAELDLIVEGSTGATDVTMWMQEVDGRWTVVDASIPL
jgi:hypothetical protein